jgi:hypothetical protein
MTSLIVESDQYDSPAELKKALERVVTECDDTIDKRDLATSEVAFYHETIHPEWECGEPCPECDGTRISVVSPGEGIYHSKDGEFEYMDNGDLICDALSFMCINCTEFLRHTPFEKL